MAYDIKATLDQVLTHLLASGYAGQALILEPKSPPSGAGITCALWMTSTGVVQIMAGRNTVEVHTVNVRLYRNMLSEPQEAIELELAQAASELLADFIGEYDLGANIRNVDVAGQFGTPIGTQWGYVQISGVMFRIVDITLPLVVDGSATAVA